MDSNFTARFIDTVRHPESILKVVNYEEQTTSEVPLQIVISIITLILIIYGAYLQSKTAKTLFLENKSRFMPFFSVHLVPESIDKYMIKGNNAIAFDIKLVGFNKKLQSSPNIILSSDMCAPDSAVSVLDVGPYWDLLINAEQVKDTRINLFRIQYVDFSGRKYSQTLFLKNKGLFFTKPIDVR